MKQLFLVISFMSIWACNDKKEATQTTAKFTNKAHQLVYQMTEKVGNYEKLHALKDVEYVYTYITADGQTDVVNEKYIFDGELSLGNYLKHERTLTQLEGEILQGYNGKSFWLIHEDKLVEEDQYKTRVVFNRKTNFYWFTMMQKLMDPGLIYEYIAEEEISGIDYDIVKVTFNTKENEQSDTYQLYLNKKTKLVDQFLFTVVDYNVIETPFLMKLNYEEIEGILIPSDRKYTKADWKGNILNNNWTTVKWTDIKFDNGLKKKQFEADSYIKSAP